MDSAHHALVNAKQALLLELKLQSAACLALGATQRRLRKPFTHNAPDATSEKVYGKEAKEARASCGEIENEIARVNKMIDFHQRLQSISERKERYGSDLATLRNTIGADLRGQTAESFSASLDAYDAMSTLCDLLGGALPHTSEVSNSQMVAIRKAVSLFETGVANAASSTVEGSASGANQDHVDKFILECCEAADGVKAFVSETYTAYKNWCAKKSLTVMHLAVFGRCMAKRYLHGRSSVGRWHVGLMVKQQSAQSC